MAARKSRGSKFFACFWDLFYVHRVDEGVGDHGDGEEDVEAEEDEEDKFWAGEDAAGEFGEGVGGAAFFEDFEEFVVGLDVHG